MHSVDAEFPELVGPEADQGSSLTSGQSVPELLVLLEEQGRPCLRR